MLASSCANSLRSIGHALWLSLVLLPLLGCASLEPSNYRNWSPDLAVLPIAETHGNRITVRNIRNCHYLTAEDYVVDYYDKQFDLDKIASVDFIVVPLAGITPLAHTMLSFGFDDGEYLAVSVEIRRENGEQYAFFKGILNEYEITYVVADERDLIRLRSNYRGDDVYVYRAKAPPEKVRDLFVDVMRRVNKLAVEPEFYHTLTNNCTTNIVRHINRLAPGRVPLSPYTLLPGYSDRLAYQIGLLDTDVSFEETRRRANISHLARQQIDGSNFSAAIRR